MKPALDHPALIVPPHRDRNILASLCAIVFFLAVTAAALAFARKGYALDGYYFFATLLVVLGPVILLSAVFGWAGIVDGFFWIVRSPSPRPEASEAASMFQLGAAFSLGLGFLATLVGLVIMLSSLGHPRELGPGMALCLLGQIEGIIMAVAYVAAAMCIIHRHVGPQPLAHFADSSASLAGMTLIAGTLTTLAAFCILRLGVSPGL